MGLWAQRYICLRPFSQCFDVIIKDEDRISQQCFIAHRGVPPVIQEIKLRHIAWGFDGRRIPSPYPAILGLEDNVDTSDKASEVLSEEGFYIQYQTPGITRMPVH